MINANLTRAGKVNFRSGIIYNQVGTLSKAWEARFKVKKYPHLLNLTLRDCLRLFKLENDTSKVVKMDFPSYKYVYWSVLRTSSSCRNDVASAKPPLFFSQYAVQIIIALIIIRMFIIILNIRRGVIYRHMTSCTSRDVSINVSKQSWFARGYYDVITKQP